MKLLEGQVLVIFHQAFLILNHLHNEDFTWNKQYKTFQSGSINQHQQHEIAFKTKLQPFFLHVYTYIHLYPKAFILQAEQLEINLQFTYSLGVICDCRGFWNTNTKLPVI